MKRLILVFLFFPIILWAQSTDSIPKKRKFAIGVAFSPDYSYRTLQSEASVKWLTELRDSSEIRSFGYTTGIKFTYQICKKFSAETGVLFSAKGYQTTDLSKYIIPVYYQPPQSVPTKEIIHYHYYYLGFPVKLNYYPFITKHGSFFISGSFIPAFLLEEKSVAKSVYSDGRKETASSLGSGFTSVNFSFTGGIGYQTKLAHRLSLKIESVYRRSVTPSMDAPVKEYLYSFGLDLGLFFDL